MLFNPQTRTHYQLSDVTSVVTRLLIWLFVSLFCPLSVTAIALSFKVEVLQRTTAIALPPGAQVPLTLAERVLSHLEAAENKEPDPHLRDDIRIAWITTLYASQGNRQPHIDATYRVLGLHPDKVWPAILARREALLGSYHIPQTKQCPLAESRDGDAPQKTCAYGAVSDQHTGSSCRTETKREARRALTSELGLDAPTAGVAAPADRKKAA
jgi:hypothetical protein